MIGRIIALLFVVALIYAVSVYNALVALKNQIKNAWAQIDVQLKRRHDLIPNLVETAKGYVKHERETLESIVQARSAAMSGKTVEDKIKAEGTLSNALSKFFVVVENYPDLKANANFLAVQEELTSTENKIAFARQAYNDQALAYNNKIQMFPSNIVAQIWHFTQEPFFQLDDQSERAVPQVKF